ncbi:MAG: Ig domain-containing protein [Acidobacteriota bacterium]
MDRSTHANKRLLAGIVSFLFVASFAQAHTGDKLRHGKRSNAHTTKKKAPRPIPGTHTNLSGGPDAFGYRFIDQLEPVLTYSFVDISTTGTNIVSGNNAASGPVALGAPFTFYGTVYNSLNMSTNGYLTTDGTDIGDDASNDCPLPQVPSSGGGGRIYPLHDDLVIAGGYTQFFSPCPRVNELGNGPEDCTVFQWDDTNHFGSTATFGTFDMETILYHTTGVILHQIGPGNTDQGSSSTTGIQDPTGTIGLTYACNTPGSVVDNTAVAFYICNIVLAPATLPNGTVGTPYAVTITASGGVAPYVFSITAGTLPPGLALSAVGDILGTPTTPGTYTFDVTATDPYGCTGTATYTIVINCGVITLNPATLPNGTCAPYSALISASGGTAPYTFAVTAGALPPGLALAAGGLLSGTPTTQGTYNFTVTGSDANVPPCQGTQAYTIVISNCALPVDYITGEGLGQPNPNRVRVFDGAGNPTTTDFFAYAATGYGVNVSSGQIDSGAGTPWEILTGPGPGPVYGPQVRAFDRDGIPINKVNFYAYGTLRYGVNVGGGELDGDGFAEILSGAGEGAVFGPHVRGWNYDGVQLTAIAKISYFAYGTLKYGVVVEEGDVDGDLFSEILTGPGPGQIFGAQVRGWDYDGTAIASIGKINYNAYTFTYGVNPSGGDVDNDGFAEIGTAPGPGPTNPSNFLGWNYDNATITALTNFNTTPFTTLFGGRLGLGDVNTTGNWELLAGAGRDATANSTVLTYTYVGTTLTQINAPGFIPFGTDMYGVNLSAGQLGF